MESNAFDVVVVGGGPAGASAAYNLAKSGMNVALLEKEKLPRYKSCGGVVATHVDKILDFSIEPVIERKISKILITVNLKKPFVTQSPSPFIYLVMRDKFDNFLVEKAKSVGVNIFQESPLINLQETTDGYLLTTDSQSFQAKYLIGADGANGVTRMLLGLSRIQNRSVAVEREIYATKNALEKWDDMIALDFGYLSSGYAWVFPKEKNFSIGTGGPLRVSKELIKYYDDALSYYKDRVENTESFCSTGHQLPIRSKGETIQIGRTLFVGDAAGMIEPMAGEGIYYAIRSGQIAAETIINSAKNGDENLINYQTTIDREIQPELQVAKSLLYLLDLAPNIWVPILMKPKHIFWKFFYRVFTGEKDYQDLPKKFSFVGKIFFNWLDKKLN